MLGSRATAVLYSVPLLILLSHSRCLDYVPSILLLLLKGLDPDAPIMLCRERVSAAVAAAPDKEAGKKAESEERLKVFTEICNKDVAADILTRYVHGVVKVSRQSGRFSTLLGTSFLHVSTNSARSRLVYVYDKLLLSNGSETNGITVRVVLCLL